MASHLVTLRDYLRLIFRRKYVVLVPILLSLVLTVPICVIVPPTYKAIAIVKRQDLAVVSSSSSALVSDSGSRLTLETLRGEMLTYPSLKRVVEQLKLDVDLHTPQDWQDKYEDLLRRVRMSPRANKRGISLIEISVTDANPDHAQQIANAIADNYVEESKKSAREGTRDIVAFHQAKEKEYLEKLRQAEDELQEFNRKRFTDLPQVKAEIAAKLWELERTKDTHEFELTELQNELAELDKQLPNIPMTIESEVMDLENPAYTELKAKLNAYERQLESLLVRNTERHPTVVSLKKDIENLKKQLGETDERKEDSIKRIVNPAYQQTLMSQLELRKRIRGHKGALTQVRAMIATYQNEMRDVVADEKRYSDLVREKEKYNRFYMKHSETLIAARSRLQLEHGDYGTEVTMIARAHRPARPDRADRIKLIIACIGAGCAAGVAMMFGIEFADQSLRDVEDAATYLNIPILGSILTIVTPEDRARRKRRILLTMFIAAGLVFVFTVFCIVWNYLHPGSLENLMLTFRQYL